MGIQDASAEEQAMPHELAWALAEVVAVIAKYQKFEPADAQIISRGMNQLATWAVNARPHDPAEQRRLRATADQLREAANDAARTIDQG